MRSDTVNPAPIRTGVAGKITGAWWLGPGLIACVSLVYYLTYHLHFIDLVDEGFLVNGALRVLDGQRPVTDFWAYPPGRYLLLAGAFKYLGTHLTTERYLLVTLLVLRNVLIYRVARRLLPTAAAVVVALTFMLVPGPWHKVFYSLPVFAHLFLLLCYIDKPTTRRAAYCGALSGLSLYLRQDIAVFSLLTLVFVVMAVRLVGTKDTGLSRNAGLTHRVSVLRHLAAAAGCAALVLIPAILYYAPACDFELLFRRLGTDPLRVADTVYQKSSLVPIRHLPNIVAGSTGGWMNYRFLNAWFPWVLYLGLGLAISVGLYTVWRWFRGEKIDTQRALKYAALLAWSALAMTRLVKLPSARTCLTAGQGMMIVIAVLLITMWAWARRDKEQETNRGGLVLPDWPKSLRWVLTIPFTLVVMLSWFWLLLLALIPVARVPTGSASCLFEADTPLSLPRAELVLPEPLALSLYHVVTQVQARTGAGQPIFAYRQAMFYFLADRPNATSFDNIMPPVALLHEAQTMAEAVVETHPPAIQIIDLSELWTAKVLERYPDFLRSALFTNYQPTYRFGDYLLLEPSPGSDAWEQIDPLWHRIERKRGRRKTGKR